MGEPVASFRCEACGAISLGTHCFACAANAAFDDCPDTVRDPQGPKWWGQPKKGKMATWRLAWIYDRTFTMPPESAVQPKKRGRPRVTEGEMPSVEEQKFLRAMINAVREMLGMEHLYGKAKKHRAPGSMSIHDPDEGNRRVSSGRPEW